MAVELRTHAIPRAAVPLLMALALALRIHGGWATLVGDHPPPQRLKGLHRPPLYEGLAELLPVPPSAWMIAAGMGTVWLCFKLASAELGPRRSLLVLLAAALCPPLIFTSWAPWFGGLCVLLAAATALRLIQVLRPHRSAKAIDPALALAAVLLLAVDWSAWPPVLAWLGWLLFFRPGWLPWERARRATLSLGLGVLIAVPIYAWILLLGADPQAALGWSSEPLGARALSDLLDSLSAPLLASPGDVPLYGRALLALLVVAAISQGHRQRTKIAGHAGSPWATVLVLGSAGALIPALALHPWIPVAAHKYLWYTAPFVICLGAAALPIPEEAA